MDSSKLGGTFVNSSNNRSTNYNKIPVDTQKVKNVRYLSQHEYKKKLENDHYPKSSNFIINLNNINTTSNNIPANNIPNNSYSTTPNLNQTLSTSRSRKNNSDLMLNSTILSRNKHNETKTHFSISNVLNILNSKEKDIKMPTIDPTIQDIDPLLTCYYVAGSHQTYNRSQKEELFQKYNIQNSSDLSNEKLVSILLNKDNIDAKLKAKKIVREQYFKNHKKALKKVNVNRQIHDIINDILSEKQTKSYLESYVKEKNFKSKVESMPLIKVSMSGKKLYDYNQSPILDKDKDTGYVDFQNNMSIFYTREEIFKTLSFKGSVVSYQNNRPKSRVQTSLILVGNKIIMFGGMGSNIFDDLWQCDLRDRYTWTQIKPFYQDPSSGRLGHTMVYYKKKVFIYGGALSETCLHQDDFLVYDISKNFFSKEKILGEVRMRRNHIAELVGSFMFIHGGIEKKFNKYLNDYWFLDLDKMKWTLLDTKGHPPPPLAYHCSTLALPTEYKLHPNFSVYKFPEVPSRIEHSRSKNEGIYIYGGIDSDNKIRNELRLLKIGKKPLEWCLIKTKGTPPDGRVSATLNYFEELNVLILYGGKCEDQSISSDMFICDLENYNWNKVLIFDRSPADRAEHSSCIIGKNLIIFGGVNKNRYLGSDMYIIELELWNKKKKRGCIKENTMNTTDDIKLMLKNI